MKEEPKVSIAALRQMIRTRLAAGSLFPIDGTVLAGKATGKRCPLCRRLILDGDIEQEVVVGPTTVFAHWEVFAHWDCYSIRHQVEVPCAEGVRAAALARLEQLSAQPVRRRPVDEGRLHRALKLVHRERLLQEGLAGRELDAVRLNLVDIVR